MSYEQVRQEYLRDMKRTAFAILVSAVVVSVLIIDYSYDLDMMHTVVQWVKMLFV